MSRRTWQGQAEFNVDLLRRTWQLKDSDDLVWLGRRTKTAVWRETYNLWLSLVLLRSSYLLTGCGIPKLQE